MSTSDRDHLNFGCLTPKNTREHAQTLMSINSMKHGVFIATTNFLTEKSEGQKEDYSRQNLKQWCHRLTNGWECCCWHSLRNVAESKNEEMLCK